MSQELALGLPFFNSFLLSKLHWILHMKGWHKYWCSFSAFQRNDLKLFNFLLITTWIFVCVLYLYRGYWTMKTILYERAQVLHFFLSKMSCTEKTRQRKSIPLLYWSSKRFTIKIFFKPPHESLLDGNFRILILLKRWTK